MLASSLLLTDIITRIRSHTSASRFQQLREGNYCMDILGFLAMLPERARNYMDALSANNLLSEEQCRLELCSVIEYLLDAHLSGRQGWEPSAWVDGILPAALD